MFRFNQKKRKYTKIYNPVDTFEIEKSYGKCELCHEEYKAKFQLLKRFVENARRRGYKEEL